MNNNFNQQQNTFNVLLEGGYLYSEIEKANNFAFDIYGFNGIPELSYIQLKNMNKLYIYNNGLELPKQTRKIIKGKIECQ